MNALEIKSIRRIRAALAAHHGIEILKAEFIFKSFDISFCLFLGFFTFFLALTFREIFNRIPTGINGFMEAKKGSKPTRLQPLGLEGIVARAAPSGLLSKG